FVRGGVKDEFDDHPHLTTVRFLEESPEVGPGTVVRRDFAIVGHIIPVTVKWSRVERDKPDGVDEPVFEAVTVSNKPGQISNAVAIAVVKSADRQLVYNGIFVPELSTVFQLSAHH